MLTSGTVILVDTTLIIEAHKVGCWKALVNHFRIETVEKCAEECATGDPLRRDRVEIDPALLQRQVKIHKVPPSSFVSASLRSRTFPNLDPGERELLAYAFNRSDDDAWLLSSQDRACIRVGFELGLIDRFVSLEKMARSVGLNRIALKDHFTEQWLKGRKLDHKLGRL